MAEHCLKILAPLAIGACIGNSYGSLRCHKKDKKKECCNELARKRAEEINAAIDATFPLLVPATAQQSATAFTSFFADDGVFQFPGGIIRGKTAIYDTYLAYAQAPGEMNQHVITRKQYWDAEKSTLSVERTWYATLTVDTPFCGTIVPAGTTYSQDDFLCVRFACDSKDCKSDCVLPGKVVYYNEYFNTAQFQSNYTSVYPAPCHCIGEAPISTGIVEKIAAKKFCRHK